jgi:DNA repair exonuclease SbcCD nuclease subunit
MKIAILGDTHFGVRNDHPIFHKHQAKFYNEVFFPYLEENNILHVVQLGDVFDRRKFVNFNTLKHSKQCFFEKLNQEYSSWLLIGNHDTYFKNTNEVNSPGLVLGEYHNINCVNDPVEIEFDGVDVLLVPWISDDNQQRCFDMINNTKAQVLMGHFEIDGFEMHKGSLHQGGLDRDIFKKFDLVLSGHFHHKSTYGNITYVGTPYEMTWSDYDDQKGFHIFDTETRELMFVPYPSILFHKVHYDDLDKQISDVVNVDFNQYSETFVKLIVRNKTNPYCFDMFVDRLEKAGVYSVQVVDDHFHMDAADDEDIISQAEDTRTILSKFVKQVDDSVNKQSLEKLVMSLYEEALSVEHVV